MVKFGEDRWIKNDRYTFGGFRPEDRLANMKDGGTHCLFSSIFPLPSALPFEPLSLSLYILVPLSLSLVPLSLRLVPLSLRLAFAKQKGRAKPMAPPLIVC